jgi:hypothetical protein
LVIDGPRIGWIGDEAGAGQQRADRVVDLQHGLVTPAFVDAHVHMTDTGLSLAGLDLSDARTLGEVLERVHQQARSGRGRPILGRGWDETRWPERRAPTSTELDRAGFGGAVYLARVDAHSAVVSSALLAAVRDLPGYRADGHLTRAAHDAARTEALTTLGPGRTVELQRTALRHAASLGIACVHEMAGPSISSADDLAALLALAAAEPVPEVIGYWGELFGIDTALELGAVGAAGDLFCDGSLGSHTAALHEPYQDRPDTHGMLRFETADLAEHIARCSAAGLQAGFHAIGDAAVDQVLGAVELAGGVEHRAEHRTGHRIEHAEYVHDPVRLAASGLLASMQPMFDASWGGRDGMYAERLGTRRAGELNRFAALHGAGVPLAFGSDAPVTPLGPWAAVRAAVHPHEPGSALDPARAFAAHTSGGWRAAGRRGGGALAPGVPATLAIWAGGGPVDAATGLPDLAPGHDLPACLATLRDGTPIFDGGVLAG